MKRASPDRKRGWLHLLGGTLVLVAGVLALELSTARVAAVAPVYEFAKERQFDTGELFYTDSETSGAVEFRLLKKRQAEARRSLKANQ